MVALATTTLTAEWGTVVVVVVAPVRCPWWAVVVPVCAVVEVVVCPGAVVVVLPGTVVVLVVAALLGVPLGAVTARVP